MLRDARPDDTEAVRGVFRRSSWSNEGDRPLLTAHPEYLDWSPEPSMVTRLAVIDGSIVGFASVRLGDEAAELVDLFVDPVAMRHGTGRALVDDAATLARAAGRARLEVSANDHAMAFYEHTGFVVVGTVEIESGTTSRMARGLDV